MYGITKDQKPILTRIKRIQGQLAGVEKMIQNDTYCIDIITQTSAVKQAISSLEDQMLESHMKCCLANNSQTRKKKSTQELSDEIIKVYKLKRK
jgi:DNA-binding FrmR family transcriptional regulator